MTNTATTTATTKSTIRQFEGRRIEGVTPMRTGVSLDLGYTSPAYLASSVYNKPVAVGDTMSGSYRIEDGHAGKFARVIKVSSVTSPKPAVKNGDEVMSAKVDVKNIQMTGSGYLIWSKNARHRLPVFAPFSVLKGTNLFKAATVDLRFRRNERGNLVATGIEVLATK